MVIDGAVRHATRWDRQGECTESSCLIVAQVSQAIRQPNFAFYTTGADRAGDVGRGFNTRRLVLLSVEQKIELHLSRNVNHDSRKIERWLRQDHQAESDDRQSDENSERPAGGLALEPGRMRACRGIGT